MANRDLEFEGRLLDMPGHGAHSCRMAKVAIQGDHVTHVRECPVAGRKDLLLMPPLANAHDHVRGIRPTALGGFDLPLELWLTHMSNIPRVDPYLVAASALGRQALGGIGSMMIHYTRPRDRSRVGAELQIVAKAATDIGVRVAIAVAMRDINPIGYAPDAQLLDGLEASDKALIREKMMSVPGSPAEQVRLVEELAAQIEGPLVNVQFGPYGVEWCSRPLLQLIAERSALTGRRVHTHLLESKVQREYLDHLYPEGPIHYLDRIGMLSSRLSVAHAVWIRPEEMELLAARGVTVATNASSNLSLRNGAAPVAQMHSRGVPLAMGLDGFSVDDDDDGFRELRLNYLLHRGVAFDDGIPVSDLLHMCCYGGRHSITGLKAGAGVAPSAPADLMVLDYGAISKDIIVEVDEGHVLARRATSHLLKQMVVAGAPVVRDGHLVRLDLLGVQAELDRQARHGASEYAAWGQVTTRLRQRLKQFYVAGLHHCG
jgi:cytosine/adenosine deaminase-related metal-dependent hydrolase